MNMKMIAALAMHLAALIMIQSSSLSQPANKQVTEGANNDRWRNPSVTVNPSNSDEIIIVASNERTDGSTFVHQFKSLDSGTTWASQQIALGGLYEYKRYPSVVHDAGDNVYVSVMSYDDAGRNAIAVTRSSDGGATWASNASRITDHSQSSPSETDKAPALAVDLVSNNSGYVYVAWERQFTNGANSQLWFARKASNEEDFTLVKRVSDDQESPARGASIAVGLNGDVLIAWLAGR
jgi:hypothetical protein